MNKKQIIQIAIIVIAFGASGFVLYNGFFKSNAPAPAVTSAAAGQSSTAGDTQQMILPYGSTLDFSVLNAQGLMAPDFQEPVLNFSNEVGIPVSNLVTPVSGQ